MKSVQLGQNDITNYEVNTIRSKVITNYEVNAIRSKVITNYKVSAIRSKGHYLCMLWSLQLGQKIITTY